MATQAASVPKKRWIHIIPAAFLMYTIAFMDRVNIVFAIPVIEKSLAVSATIAGLASGIFFVGYGLLQIRCGQLSGGLRLTILPIQPNGFRPRSGSISTRNLSRTDKQYR